MVLLLALVLLVSWRMFAASESSSGGPVRALSFARSWVLAMTLAVLSAEVLPLFTILDRGGNPRTGMLIFWLAVLLLLVWRLASIVNREGIKGGLLPGHRPLLADWFTGSMLVAGSLILIVTGVTAAAAAPNNWDSMTYHLSRVVHWLDQGSVAHYFTGIDRQLSQPPAAEYGLLHLYAVAGGDNWVNILQWTALAVCAVSVYSISVQLGGVTEVNRNPAAYRSRGMFASLFVLTVPMAICQASSTQNDLVVSSLLAASAAFCVDGWRSDRMSSWGWAGVAASLAVLTKGTALLVGIPLFGAAAVILIRRHRAAALRPALFSLAMLLMLNGPHWFRNTQTFGTPLGPSYGLSNVRYTPGALISNGTKQLSQELRTPSREINQAMEKVVQGIHNVLGIDVNDSQLHWPGSPGYRLIFESRGEYFHEDYASATLHTLLLLIAVVGMWKFRRSPVAVYGIVWLLAVVLFPLILRWQIWHPRLHLPLFILAAPFAASWWSRQPSGGKALVAASLVIWCIPFLLFNESRKFAEVLRTDRQEQYFRNRPDAQSGYAEAMSIAQSGGPAVIGLITSGDSWEYPLWTMKEEGTQIRHVRLQETHRPPLQYLFVWKQETAKFDTLQTSAGEFSRVQDWSWEGSPAVFERILK